MTDDSGLLAAILSRPDDDAPRLIYADWLDDHSEEGSEAKDRAAFIRVQVELAKPEPTCEAPASPGLVPCPEWNAQHPSRDNWCKPCAARRDLREQQAILLTSSGRPWTRAVVPSADRYYWPNVHDGMTGATIGRDAILFVWRRGFIESLTANAAHWLTHADAIYWHPDQKVHVIDSHGKPAYYHRPMPATAHPVREVRLTTLPMLEHEGYARRIAGGKALVPVRYSTRSHVELCLEAEWPGIRFHLPPEPRHFTNATGNNDVDDPRNWSGGRVAAPGDEVTLTFLAPWMHEHFELVTGGLQTQSGPGATLSLRMNPPVIRRRHVAPPAPPQG